MAWRLRISTPSAEWLPTELLTSAITLAELSAGIHSADDVAERARRIARLQRVEATFNPLPFDAEAARQYGNYLVPDSPITLRRWRIRRCC